MSHLCRAKPGRVGDVSPRVALRMGLTYNLEDELVHHLWQKLSSLHIVQPCPGCVFRKAIIRVSGKVFLELDLLLNDSEEGFLHWAFERDKLRVLI